MNQNVLEKYDNSSPFCAELKRQFYLNCNYIVFFYSNALAACI